MKQIKPKKQAITPEEIMNKLLDLQNQINELRTRLTVINVPSCNLPHYPHYPYSTNPMPLQAPGYFPPTYSIC